jgi:hypothetical protein
MLKHDRKVHTGVKDYECRVCDAEVTDIQIHMRVSGSSPSLEFLTVTAVAHGKLILKRVPKEKFYLHTLYRPSEKSLFQQKMLLKIENSPKETFPNQIMTVDFTLKTTF